MKKIFAIIISVLLFISMTVVSHGHDDITINIAFDNEQQTFTITGHIDFTRGRIPVGLFITQGDDIVAVADTIAVGKEEEGIPYTFSNVKLIPSTRTGDISIKVTTSEIDYSAQTSYTYLGVDSKLIALKTLKSAIASGDYDTLKTAVLSTKNELGVDENLFLSLSERASRIAMNNLFGLTITELDDWNIDNITDEQSAQITEHIKLYQKQYQEAIKLGEFFDCTSSAKLKAWYDENKIEYGFLSDDDQTVVDETTFLGYFDQAILTDDFSKRTENIEFVKTMKELNIEMKKQAVLQIISDSNQSVPLNIISNFSELLSNVYDVNGQNPISINYADWNGMSEDQKTAVCINIAGNSYRDIYDLVSAVNSQITLNKNTAQIGSPVIGGNAVGRGDKGNREVFVPLPDKSQTTGGVLSFNDIGNVKWAEEAISYLYSKNIISGRNNETFAPDDQVTRAELVKMLVLGFNLKGDSTASFNDVNSSAWYAQYVSIAAANGLIKGDENGNFNPNKPVSRQDAAVMMYRAIGGASKADKAYFVDYEKISPYAQNAVNYMYENGVINGMGNGIFAPQNNLTRAQSAKMIYGLLVR